MLCLAAISKKENGKETLFLSSPPTPSLFPPFPPSLAAKKKKNKVIEMEGLKEIVLGHTIEAEINKSQTNFG